MDQTHTPLSRKISHLEIHYQLVIAWLAISALTFTQADEDNHPDNNKIEHNLELHTSKPSLEAGHDGRRSLENAGSEVVRYGDLNLPADVGPQFMVGRHLPTFSEVTEGGH